jgi:hypothetical protein
MDDRTAISGLKFSLGVHTAEEGSSLTMEHPKEAHERRSNDLE